MIDGRRLVALLLLGGAGLRLWPVSRDACPKPFLKLLGPRSLYQMTLARLSAAGVDEIVAVANAGTEPIIRAQAEEIGHAPPGLVLEPFARDSGPAIAAGVAAVLQRDRSDAVILAAPGDHLIPDEEAFARAVADAADVALHDRLVTFGIRATSASTEYGYIRRGKQLPDRPGAFEVESFHEKPQPSAAEAYLRAGGYDWNSGIFVFAGRLFAREAERHMPEIWRAAKQAVTAQPQDPARLVLDDQAFVRAPKMSIDYALLEKSERVATIPVSFEWSDIGSWTSVHSALPKDRSGNATIGEAMLQDVSGALVIADGAKVVVVGMNDVVVVASPQGTLVAPRARAAEIKGLV